MYDPWVGGMGLVIFGPSNLSWGCDNIKSATNRIEKVEQKTNKLFSQNMLSGSPNWKSWKLTRLCHKKGLIFYVSIYPSFGSWLSHVVSLFPYLYLCLSSSSSIIVSFPLPTVPGVSFPMVNLWILHQSYSPFEFSTEVPLPLILTTASIICLDKAVLNVPTNLNITWGSPSPLWCNEVMFPLEIWFSSNRVHSTHLCEANKCRIFKPFFCLLSSG